MFGPIRTLCLAAALYLPLAFFLWFAFAKTLVYPVGLMAGSILHGWLPDLFLSFARDGYQVDVQTAFWVNQATSQLFTAQQAGTNPAWVSSNPMIFGYGLPVIAALALATPIGLAERFKQIGVGLALVWLVQTNGVVWDVLQSVNFHYGPIGQAAIAEHGISATLIAAMYQFAYLILPPLTPVILWAVMNRKFIENLIKLDHIQSLDEFADLPAAEPATAAEQRP